MLTPQDLAQAENEGLLDEAHLQLFLTWYALGGMERGIGMMELASMPAALRHDIVYLVSELGRARRSRQGGQRSQADQDALRAIKNARQGAR